MTDSTTGINASASRSLHSSIISRSCCRAGVSRCKAEKGTPVIRSMYQICGGDFADKMHLLMDFTSRPGEVADPWYTGDFDATWRDVIEGCQGLLDDLLKKRGVI